MASSDVIKEGIQHYFNCTGVPNSEKDWKRTSKKNISGQIIREFENKVIGRSIFTIGDDEDAEIVEKGQWIYGVYKDDDSEELTLSFEPLDRWQRQGLTYDQHQLNLLLTMFLLPEDMLDEVSENSFVVDASYNELAVHMILKKHRILHDQSYTNFLNDTTNSPGPFSIPNPLPPFPIFDATFVAVGSKTGLPAGFQPLSTNPATLLKALPANPFGANMPPAMQAALGKMGITSNHVAAATKPAPAPQAPSNPGALGGFYGTGLNEDGTAKANDFIAAVVEDDGEVLVMITPMMAYARGEAFDRNVGGLVDHLLPADWDETSEQTYIPGTLDMVLAFDFLATAGFNVDWKEYKDQFKGSYDVYDVTAEQHKANVDAVMNPVSTMPQHHHNPIPVNVASQAPNTTGYPELAGQEPAVQAALVGARVRGVLGLEQESSKWDDAEDIEKSWDTNRFYNANREEGYIELERSHALWLLYEHYDQGSGLAFPNFFGMDDVRIQEEVLKILDVDLDEDDDEELVIRGDLQPYPAPYDLPVPAYVPPAPIVQVPVIQTSKPAPKPQKAVARGPSQGKMTGSGSFAPISTGPVAQVDEDDTPTHATQIDFDSGEQWPEFCGQVWDIYSKNGPGAFTWIDRWRPRHAQIIGLGYKFERVEFTGIRVQMGYLDKKFQIIDNIDIPGAVFDELFPDGGHWNDDDNVQEINKKPGTDPETGFSYSSQDLWETVEPMLRAKGWLPAK